MTFFTVAYDNILDVAIARGLRVKVLREPLRATAGSLRRRPRTTPPPDHRIARCCGDNVIVRSLHHFPNPHFYPYYLQRTLAAAVATRYAESVTLFDDQVDVVKDHGFAERDPDPAACDDRHPGRLPYTHRE